MLLYGDEYGPAHRGGADTPSVPLGTPLGVGAPFIKTARFTSRGRRRQVLYNLQFCNKVAS